MEKPLPLVVEKRVSEPSEHRVTKRDSLAPSRRRAMVRSMPIAKNIVEPATSIRPTQVDLRAITARAIPTERYELPRQQSSFGYIGMALVLGTLILAGSVLFHA